MAAMYVVHRYERLDVCADSCVLIVVVCQTYDACIQDNTSSSVTTVTTLSSSSQCDAGYKGVMCAVCEDNYYRVSNGSCKRKGAILTMLSCLPSVAHSSTIPL